MFVATFCISGCGKYEATEWIPVPYLACCLRATVDTAPCSGVGNIFREERLREKKEIFYICVGEFLVIINQGLLEAVDLLTINTTASKNELLRYI